MGDGSCTRSSVKSCRGGMYFNWGLPSIFFILLFFFDEVCGTHVLDLFEIWGVASDGIVTTSRCHHAFFSCDYVGKGFIC